MASRYVMTEKKIERFVKERRGEGYGPAYIPWLKIQDLSSLGRVARMHSTTANREHHFFSDLEYAFGLESDWDTAVLDLREQFPLQRAATLAIAQDIGVKHPTSPGSSCHVVMTTDLLLDLKIDGGIVQLAVAIKYASDLEGKRSERVIEKLEIERRYWRQRNVAWTLMTEREIIKGRGETYRRLRQSLDFDNLKPPAIGTWMDRARMVEVALSGHRGGTVAKFCADLDRTNGWEHGDALNMIWHLLANRRIGFDLAKGLDGRGPISQLEKISAATATAAA